ncbi:MAG: hypothetical protein V8S98_01230 [Lachnospiraceae bacterium]
MKCRRKNFVMEKQVSSWTPLRIAVRATSMAPFTHHRRRDDPRAGAKTDIRPGYLEVPDTEMNISKGFAFDM